MLTPTYGQQTAALLRCFAAYVGSILAFGILYHYLYRQVPTRFLFARDIATSQKAYVREARSKALSRARFARLTLSDLLPLLGTSRASITGDFYRVATLDPPGGGSLKLVALTGAPAGGIRGVAFSYRDTDGEDHDFGTIDGEVPPHNMAEFDVLLRNRITQLERGEADLQRSLEGLEVSDSQVWGFFGFLYFSTITQTTVGYGDILPNSSLIRAIVVAQILVGYAVLVVVLNIAILEMT